MLLLLLQLVVHAIESGDSTVLSDARRIGQYKEGEAIEVQDLANRLFHTVFMGTENSSSDTRSRCAQCPEEWLVKQASGRLHILHLETSCLRLSLIARTLA